MVVEELIQVVRSAPRDKAAIGALYDSLQETGLTAREAAMVRNMIARSALETEAEGKRIAASNRVDLSTPLRSMIRKAAKSSNGTMPVVVVCGRSAPKELGADAYYTTPAGGVIHHPNAYRWPKVRHNSTRRVEVGAEWVLARS